MSSESHTVAEAAKTLDKAVEFTSDLWATYWCVTCDYRSPLLEVIEGFSAHVFDLVEARFPALRGMPGPALGLIVVEAVVRSGTHSRAVVEAALGALLA